MPKKKKIVIVGGGFAGVRLALDLEKHVYKDAEVVLIDDTGRHEYTPGYYRAATAPLSEAAERIPSYFRRLTDQISIPLSEIIDPKKITLIIGSVGSIDAKNKSLTLADGKTVDFEWLVLAAGSKTRFFDIPKLSEYSYVLKSADDALNIRDAVHELFSRAAKHEDIRIVVVGGGFTGTEIAAAIAPYARTLAKHHGHPLANVYVTIIEAGPRLIGGASSWISEKAQKRAEALGVKLIFNNPITAVSKNTITPKAGREIPYDILIWTAGVAANPLAFEITGARLDDKGCLIVDDRLRVLPYENIFAIGDMAFCSSMGPVGASMTAQVAIQQGRYLAHTLKRLLHKRPTFSYYFHRAKHVIPLGAKFALVDLGWIKFSGYLGWCLKCLITLYYLTTILPWSKAIKRWRSNI